MFKNSATEAFRVQDYKKAVADLTAAISLDPFNQIFYSYCSVAWLKMKMYNEALEDADTSACGCSPCGLQDTRAAAPPSGTWVTCMRPRSPT